MASDETGLKWWLRYVVVPLVGGGGLVAVFVAVLTRPPSSVPTPIPLPSALPPTPGRLAEPSDHPRTPSPAATALPTAASPGLEPHDARVEVEKLVARWCSAWLRGDASAFVGMAAEPFYFDQKILLTRADLRSAYEAVLREKAAVWREVEIARIRVETARELSASGRDLSQDRVFTNMNLTLDDYAVTLLLRSHGHQEGAVVVVRRVGGDLEVVGIWD